MVPSKSQHLSSNCVMVGCVRGTAFIKPRKNQSRPDARCIALLNLVFDLSSEFMYFPVVVLYKCWTSGLGDFLFVQNFLLNIMHSNIVPRKYVCFVYAVLVLQKHHQCRVPRQPFRGGRRMWPLLFSVVLRVAHREKDTFSAKSRRGLFIRSSVHKISPRIPFYGASSVGGIAQGSTTFRRAPGHFGGNLDIPGAVQGCKTRI